MYLIKNEKGLVMPLVLIVMIVLALLGGALWQYSVSDIRQVAQAEDKARAYYVARSAAETMARHIMKEPGLVSELPDETFNISDEVTLSGDFLGDAGEMSVSIEHVGGDIHEITGIGITNGVRQTATVVLLLSEFPVEDAVLVSTGDQDINFHSGMTVEGNIVSGGEVSVPDLYDGPVFEYGDEEPENGGQYKAIKNFPFPDDYFAPVVVPQDPDETINSMTISNNDTYTIDAGDHIEISSLTVNNGGTLRFLTESGTTTILVVDNLDFKNGCTVTIDDQGKGYGVVRVYVREEMKAHSPQMDFPEDARLQFFLAEGSSVSFNGNVNFGGLIYGPYNTHVYLQSNAQVVGALIVETISGQGGANIIGAAQNALKYFEGLSDLEFPEIVNMLYWKP